MRLLMLCVLICVSGLAGCQSATSVVVMRPADEIAAVLRERYGQEHERGGIQMRRMSDLKEASSGGRTQFDFIEAYDKAWSIRTVVMIERRGSDSSRVYVFSERVAFDIPFSRKDRREDVEGRRMAQLLRWVVPEGDGKMW